MEQNKKIKLIRTAVMVAVLVFAVNLVPRIFNSEANNLIGSKYSLKERAEIMNRDCPFVIDENTRLDSVTAPGEDILQNNYTLLLEHRDNIDVEAFQNILKPEITTQLKAMPEAEDLRKTNTTLVYKYFDKDHSFVTDIVMLPGEY
ncbi:hypothetical protein [Salinimicrobium xinjiangense]|uniref:hypothetical protein n=1 Tax=Salinimicrobium xinjiangense TaxID=438596 RepID=UPI0012EC0D8A|nr:hypothetical protein [Salinimicrobium xinjiangense]